MIKETKKQIELEFGNGDICINSSYYINSEKEKIGIITFSNQPAKKIGSEGNVKIGQNCKMGDFPIIMTFTKIESIQALIDSLLITEKTMISREEM